MGIFYRYVDVRKRCSVYYFSGNIAKQTGSTQNPGIKEYLDSGRNYPSYLLQKSSRIGPAQSCFALTVGSICIGEYEDDDKISLGRLNYPSSFQEQAWEFEYDKPDEVEYGGDFTNQNYSRTNYK